MHQRRGLIDLFVDLERGRPLAPDDKHRWLVLAHVSRKSAAAERATKWQRAQAAYDVTGLEPPKTLGALERRGPRRLLGDLGQLGSARRERLLPGRSSIPSVLWFVLLVIVALSNPFHADNRTSAEPFERVLAHMEQE